MLLLKALQYDVNDVFKLTDNDAVLCNMTFVLKFFCFIIINAILFSIGDNCYLIVDKICLNYMYCLSPIFFLALISMIVSCMYN